MRRQCLAVVWCAILGLSGTTASRAAEAKTDFARDGIGFVRKHCVGCHGAKAPKADLSLQAFVDESSVVAGRKVWEGVVKMVRSGEMPPVGRPKPSADEVDAFLKSSQSVFVRNSKADPGQVTLRRLNRAEYNNTIRDLLGLDFNPAEDFPADGVGYGFDNIGDVLTVSPILLERYLSAAESIVERVQISPPRARNLRVDSTFLNPQGRDIRDKFRPLFTKGRTLEMKMQAGHDGVYILRAKVYAEQLGGEPVKAVLIHNQRELQTFEVKATDTKSAEIIECEFRLDVREAAAMEMRVAIALANPFQEGAAKRTLWVEYMDLIPPPDFRPAAQRRLFPPTPLPKADRTREFVTRLAAGAYRRPPTADEVSRLVKLVEAVEKEGLPPDFAMRRAVQAVLVSPKFLFRVELDDRPDSPAAHPIDEHQLACRLSYFLWSSMPDDELFALAGSNKLTANLEAQVRRMLVDPKAKALVDNFAMQWLQMGRLDTFSPEPKLFPAFNEPLRKAMRRETELFVEAVIRENRSVLDLIDADFTFLNEPLAKHYGIADTNGNRAGRKAQRPAGQPIRGDKFVRVNLIGGERGGMLTHASLLAGSSSPTRTSPVKRGNWVLERILGTPPPPPPPNVPPLPETAKGEIVGTVRQRLELHRSNPACAGCHGRIDPIGFAFENYDSIGAFRTQDGGVDIDASATLPDGRTFTGVPGLKAILKDKKELFARCLTEKLLTYALGRGVEFYDEPTIDRILAATARDDYRFAAIVAEIVRSDPFRLRRGKELSKNP